MTLPRPRPSKAVSLCPNSPNRFTLVSPVSETPTTPLMRQYHALKQLEITLTSRNKEKGDGVPMCGVPRHSADNYIARLVQKGYRVALCDQMEEPSQAKGLVRRDVTRIVTPGTATESNLLRTHENNYLAAVAFEKDDRCIQYA